MIEALKGCTATLLPLLSCSRAPQSPGADPEVLQGRWLMGWLLIENYTGVRRVAG